jgi:hypothetical protein
MAGIKMLNKDILSAQNSVHQMSLRDSDIDRVTPETNAKKAIEFKGPGSSKEEVKVNAEEATSSGMIVEKEATTPPSTEVSS